MISVRSPSCITGAGAGAGAHLGLCRQETVYFLQLGEGESAAHAATDRTYYEDASFMVLPKSKELVNDNSSRTMDITRPRKTMTAEELWVVIAQRYPTGRMFEVIDWDLTIRAHAITSDNCDAISSLLGNREDIILCDPAIIKSMQAVDCQLV
jgi:hypothetical protein